MSDMLIYQDGELFWKESRGRVKAGQKAGTVNVHGYNIVTLDNKKCRSARVIWEMHNGPIPEGMEIDHINRDKLDDRIENLRLATSQEQKQNRGTKGVYFDPRRATHKWWSRITLDNGHKKYLGGYETEQEARQAYIEAKKKYHGVEL